MHISKAMPQWTKESINMGKSRGKSALKSITCPNVARMCVLRDI